EVPTETRFDVKRRLGIPHPLESKRDHSRRSERNEMTWHDHAGVSIGTAFATRRLAVHHGDTMTFARSIVCRAQPNHAGANYKDLFRLRHSARREQHPADSGQTEELTLKAFIVVRPEFAGIPSSELPSGVRSRP